MMKDTKAILVIDKMPKNCAECRIRLSGESNEWCWYLKHGLDDIKAKPSWCPLKPMPVKWTAQINGLSSDQQIANWNFAEGWNKCLERIEK